MPDPSIFFLPGAREKGIGLINQLIGNLQVARGADGLVNKDAFANQMIKSGKITEEQIAEMMGSAKFTEFKTFLEGDEAQKKSPQ